MVEIDGRDFSSFYLLSQVPAFTGMTKIQTCRYTVVSRNLPVAALFIHSLSVIMIVVTVHFLSELGFLGLEDDRIVLNQDFIKIFKI